MSVIVADSSQVRLVSGKLLALDGIRGLAVVLVILSHFGSDIHDAFFLKPLKFVFLYGWVGVDLFFALSGFLITGILVDTRKAENYFGSFYARRVLRIFPIYYASLFAIFALIAIMPNPPAEIPVPADRKLYFFFLTNWLVLWKGQWGPNVVGHFWSLAVEEQFYLFWPLCVWLIPVRQIKKVALGLCVLALLLRLYWIARIGGPSTAIILATVTRMDSLLAGAVAAILARDSAFRASARNLLGWILVPLSVFTVGLLCCPDQYRAAIFCQSIGYTLLAVGFSALVLRAACTDGSRVPVQRIFRNRTLTQFGKYSYGIYVYHVPIHGACAIVLYHRLPAALTDNVAFGIAYVVFISALTFVFAKLSYEGFEKYFLRLKRRFEPRLARTVTVQ